MLNRRVPPGSVGVPTAGRSFVSLFFEPQIVMFLRPIYIHLAGTHGLERALHPERADIDMRENHGDEQHGDDGVHHLCDLHPGNIGPIERKQQQNPETDHRCTGRQGKPENQFSRRR